MRASSQRQRRQAGYWRDIPRQLGEVALSVNHTTVAQLRHRMALVEFWTPAPGDQVLEVGCGQGDCTAVLAYAVGKGGKVVAADIESDTYGAPVSLRDAHRFMKSSNIGKRIEFLTCANLLDLKWDFPDEYFDLVVFAHSSWYMASLKELEELFARVRPVVQSAWLRRVVSETPEPPTSLPSCGGPRPDAHHLALATGTWKALLQCRVVDHSRSGPVGGSGCGLGGDQRVGDRLLRRPGGRQGLGDRKCEAAGRGGHRVEAAVGLRIRTRGSGHRVRSSEHAH